MQVRWSSGSFPLVFSLSVYLSLWESSGEKSNPKRRSPLLLQGWGRALSAHLLVVVFLQHDREKLLQIDFSILVDIELVDHRLQFIVAHVLPQLPRHTSQRPQ